MIPIVAPFVPTGPARCQHCGALLQASTPAADPPKDVSGDRGVVPAKDANVTDAPPPSGYMSREKML